jgi:ankyrin repeat protein
MTALQIAAYYGHTNILRIIIKHSKTKGEKHLKQVLNFLNRKSCMSALSYAIINEQKQNCLILINEKAMIYYYHSNLEKDLSPLFLSIFKKNLELVEAMYLNSKEQQLTETNSQGINALTFAAENKIQNIVNYLSARTKDLNNEDSKGITILMHMLVQMNLKMCKRLLHRGASVDHINKHGKTALHLCVEDMMQPQIEYLLFKGANPHILDFQEKDCCDKAKENGLAITNKVFNNCNIRKKLRPQFPAWKNINIVYKFHNYYQPHCV